MNIGVFEFQGESCSHGPAYEIIERSSVKK